MTAESTKASALGFDPERFIPIPHPQVELYDRGAEDPIARYALLRPDGGESALLTEEDRQVWELLDGERNVTEVCRIYLERHRKLALTRVYSLVRRLAVAQIIAPPPETTKEFTNSRPIWERLNLASRRLFTVPASKSLLTAFSKVFASCRPGSTGFHACVIVLALIGGIVAMASTATSPSPILHLSQSIDTPFGQIPSGFNSGLALILAINFLASFLREFWRGSIESSFHAKPTGVRLVVHYGIPAFQADPHFRSALPFRQRITSAVAGFELDFFLAGIASIIASVLPQDSSTAEIAAKISWVMYVRCLMHCSPSRPRT